VTLAAPETVAAGTEVTITVSVSHRGNSGFHHTKWVWIKADGVEIARWDFKRSKLPENGDFSREVKYTVNKAVEITAQGRCNIHGSKGPASRKIDID
jgi:desulfoferrodoxin (superoxide reductase-like protein)